MRSARSDGATSRPFSAPVKSKKKAEAVNLGSSLRVGFA